MTRNRLASRAAPSPARQRGASRVKNQRRSGLLLGGAIGAIAAVALVAFVLRSSPTAPIEAIATVGTADVHALRFAGSMEHLLFGHHGGVLESLDGGRSWRPLGARADAMSLEVTGQSIVIAGHEVFEASNDGGLTWAPIRSDLPSLDIHAFARSRLDPDTMWTYLAGDGIWQTSDGGLTFTRVYDGDTVALAAAVVDGRDVLLGVDPFKGLVRSDDAGRTWRVLGTPPGTPVASFATTPDGRVIVIGSGQGLHRSDDSGATWRTLIPTTTFLAVAVSDDGQTVVAISRQTEVFRSDDAGATWARPG
jgi:photosystem II stability/assembly factor-like uncharacterized protein